MGLALGEAVGGSLFLVLFVSVGVVNLYNCRQVRTNINADKKELILIIK